MRAGGAALLLAAAAWAQQVTPVQMPEGTLVRDAVYADVDADGEPDLVLATAEPARALRIHLRRAGERPFASEPDFLLKPVWEDAVAYAVGDVDPAPGAEVVLFSARGVYAWLPRAPEKERVKKLGDCAFLWQLPFPSHLPAYEAGVRDLDGDGRADLLVPEPDGYRLLLQRKPGVFATQEIVLPADPEPREEEGAFSSRLKRRVPRSRKELRISIPGRFGGEPVQRAGPLLEIADEIPAPQVADFDGDGRLDIAAQTDTALFVWTQEEFGTFGPAPRHTLRTPVVADRDRRLEVTYSAHLLDLDGDARADCVIFSGDHASDDVRTHVQVFRQKGKERLFTAEALPDQLLVLSGFAGRPRFADVDGDGRVDMMVGAFRPDLLDAIKGSSGRVDVELYLFLNRNGEFARRPDLVHRTQLEASGLRPAGRRVMARFFGDVSGDGVRDLLLRDEEARLRILLTRRTGAGLVIHPEPLWELRIAGDAELLLGPDRGPRRAPDVLVLEGSQVLVVRFE